MTLVPRVGRCGILERGDANVNAGVNHVPTFLEDSYQFVSRTRQRASLNGCLGNNVEYSTSVGNNVLCLYGKIKYLLKFELEQQS